MQDHPDDECNKDGSVEHAKIPDSYFLPEELFLSQKSDSMNGNNSLRSSMLPESLSESSILKSQQESFQGKKRRFLLSNFANNHSESSNRTSNRTKVTSSTSIDDVNPEDSISNYPDIMNTTRRFSIKNIFRKFSSTLPFRSSPVKIQTHYPRARTRYRTRNEISPHEQPGVVYEYPGPVSDGESEEASAASDEVELSGVQVKFRTDKQKDISKRLSLPADVHLPDRFLTKQLLSPTLDGPISRTLRRQSLSEIGFGKMESYIQLRMLGMGTYAMVFKGKSKLTDKYVALKIINLEHDEGAPCTAIREVSLLKDLKHNNIVTLHDIIYTKKFLTLVFEYMESDLKRFIDRNPFDAFTIKIFLFQLLRGLDYCHRRKVLHRDLKPQNLLINSKMELKLADFGLARAKSVPIKTYSHEVVTLWYRPPDVLLGSTDYTTSIDMWGVGCIFYEMATTKPLFAGNDLDEQLKIIFDTRGLPSEEELTSCTAALQKYKEDNYNIETNVKDIQKLIRSIGISEFTIVKKTGIPRLKKESIACYYDYNLLDKFLQYNPKQRISAEEAMKNSYFKALGPNVHNLPETESIIPYIPETVMWIMKKNHPTWNEFHSPVSLKKSAKLNDDMLRKESEDLEGSEQKSPISLLSDELSHEDEDFGISFQKSVDKCIGVPIDSTINGYNKEK